MAAAIRAEKKERKMAGCTREVSCKPFSTPGFASTNPGTRPSQVCKTNPETLLRSGFKVQLLHLRVCKYPETRSAGLDENRKWEVRVKYGAGAIFGKGGSKDESRRED